MTPDAVTRWAWIAWLISWLGAAFWTDRTVKRASVAREVGYRALVIAGAILLFQSYRASPATRLWRIGRGLDWILTAVVAAGLLFTWWARLHLGTLWSSEVTRKAHHRVVDTGPYALVRHPIYSGVILATLGTAAPLGTPLALAGAALMIAGFYAKARIEERFLRDELGAGMYDDYARRVPMLVPFVRT